MTPYSLLLSRLGARAREGEWLAPCPLYDQNHREGADPYKVVLSPADRRPGLLVFCRVCGRAALPEILSAWGLTLDAFSTPLTPADYSLWDSKPQPESEATLEELDRAYRLLLNSLDLSTAHRRWLNRRGFPDAAVDHFGYRTGGAQGVSSESLLADPLPGDVRKLLQRIPGSETSGDATRFRLRSHSLLLPCRSRDGSIFGIKQRITDGGRARIRLLSSSKWGGPAAVTGTHWARVGGSPPLRVILTEGERKADLTAWTLRDAVVLAAPGTARIDLLLRDLDASPYSTLPVYTAFDRDPAGEKAEREVESVGWTAYALRRLRWDRGKGIDDAIAAGVELREEETPQPREPLRGLTQKEKLIRLLGEGERPRDEIEKVIPSATLSRWIREGSLGMRKERGIGQILYAKGE